MAYRLVNDQPGDDSRGDGGSPHGKLVRRTAAVLPTMFTLGNLLCGFAAIFVASRPVNTELPFEWSALTFAAIFIFAGMVLDGLDGSVARLTRSFSDLGEQLDSMADMVTFGVAPAFLAVRLVGVEAPLTPFESEVGDPVEVFSRLTILIAGIYVACAALRLARFNIELASAEVPEHDSFKGLPTPGAAGTVASLVLLHQHLEAQEVAMWWVRASVVGMVPTMFLAAIGMVSQFRYVHVLNRYARGRAPFGTIARGVVIGGLLLVDLQGVLAAAFVLYAISAPASSLYRRATRVPQRSGEKKDAATSDAKRGSDTG